MTDWKPWLRKLAAKGGKGVVGNIDARCLGRLADQLEALEEALKACHKVCAMKQAQNEQLREEHKQLQMKLTGGEW